MEVRHAVRQLYVKPSVPGNASAAGREWQRALDGGLRREPANQDSLPGPCGGQSLHLHPKQAHGDVAEPHLPKARAFQAFPFKPECVQVNRCSAVAGANSAPAFIALPREHSCAASAQGNCPPLPSIEPPKSHML